MLPALTLSMNPPPKRARVLDDELPPCPGEIRYKDGEVLNVGDKRVTGSSSRFSSDAEHCSTLSTPVPSTWADMVHLLGTDNMQRVLLQLYASGDGSMQNTQFDTDEGGAYRLAYNNAFQSQYYLLTIEVPVTVTHIVSDGAFWGRRTDVNTKIGPGVCAYTNGFLWCNTSPNWAWKASGDKCLRCRIELPAGTQVVVDRSPTDDTNECEFDEQRYSIFPDVLLPPGVFNITSVDRYRGATETVVCDRFRPAAAVWTDAEYTQRMLMYADEFVDVQMEVTQMMRLPKEMPSQR